MNQVTYDVIVIGSGAGGAAAAYRLSLSGTKVLIIEAGPQYNPLTDYPLAANDWEQKRFPYKLGSQVRYTVAEMQTLDKQHNTLRSWNHKSKLFHSESRRQNRGYEHLQAVGGSTLRYTGEAHRLNPAAMKLASEYGVGADWPISYSQLEPFYSMAEQVIGVAGDDNQSARPRSQPYPLPAHKMSYASQMLAKGFKSLNLNWQANSLAALSKPYDGRPPCNQCGQCALGCSRLDKGTADLTFIAKALATGNCELRAECRVTELIADSLDKVAAVNYVDLKGDGHQARASTFILAGGAIETPRLLLNSSTISNDDGQIGKHFLETLSWKSSALHPDNIGSHRGHPSNAICWDFNSPDAIEGVIGGCRFSLGIAEAGLAGPAAYANRVVGGWGREQKQKMRDQFGRVLSIGAIGESLPNDKSFIDLDPDVKDHLGLPVARIHSYLDDMAIQRIRFMAKKTRELLLAAGTQQPFEENGTYDLFHSTHVFGGCRMGQKSAESVVNADQQSHRYKNLYIADASVFPSTGGGESPALTISALALRAAEKLLKNHA